MRPIKRLPTWLAAIVGIPIIVFTIIFGDRAYKFLDATLKLGQRICQSMRSNREEGA